MGADARAGLERLWHTAGGDPAALGRVPLTGARRAAITAFHSERCLRIDGQPGHRRDPLFGF